MDESEATNLVTEHLIVRLVIHSKACQAKVKVAGAGIKSAKTTHTFLLEKQ